MQTSPASKLLRFKRRSNTLQAQRLDMKSLLLNLDRDLAERTAITNKTKAGTFFEELSILTNHANQCPPGSILPTVPSRNRSNHQRNFNGSFRSVGYASPPSEPWSKLSQTNYSTAKYMNQTEHGIATKTYDEHRSWTAANVHVDGADKRVRPKLKLSNSAYPSPSKLVISPIKRSKSTFPEQEAMLSEIMKMHQKVVSRDARVKRNKNKQNTGNPLYDHEVKLERRERKQKLTDAMINDADKSIQAVVARETRRIERMKNYVIGRR